VNGSAGISAILKSSRCAAAAGDDLGVHHVHRGTDLHRGRYPAALSYQLTQLIEQFPDMIMRRFEAQAV
jgi:hypothetical protein